MGRSLLRPGALHELGKLSRIQQRRVRIHRIGLANAYGNQALPQ
ncbi:hypothetical protein TPL01_03030 [Sulfuriferula plumbiphila]|uniref:Uncharacterized protein n=1 Tax=Sulfuriferula plumbiphila TaxID=171865 RepID=A0A512L3W8_9PROT|nr:hypothetical protein SFPGR_29600 [Sulfuriferula plumbiphila]GEP29165.1 hypothetical protein TPL01_03030 [Sulfuriferula plumbiphila]